MPITYKRGNLIDDPADALVNTVNCVGRMGKGIALAFKQRYPRMFAEYRRRCFLGAVVPGEMDFYLTARGRWLVNFPTKRHWREGSRLDDIRSGLAALRAWLCSRPAVRSIAVPALGCANGGLRWVDVRPEIEAALGDLDSVDVFVYEPLEEPSDVRACP